MMPSPAVLHSIDVVLDRTDQALLADCLSSLLHSIFFHRIFGNIQPLTRDILDVTFPYAEDMDLQSLIDSKTAAFIRYVDSVSSSDSNDGQHGGDAQIRATMSIQFFEKVTRRASWWASKAAESEVCWEKWDINCEFLPLSRNERDRSKARIVMEGQLSSALRKIVLLTQRTDHIPPITTNEANPFPYQILTPSSASGGGVEGEGWGAVLKKTLFDAAGPTS